MIRFAAIVVGACTGLLLAQPSNNQDQDPDIDAAPLAGPRVATGGESGLVEHAYDGRLRRLDVPAPEAAVELLGLDAETRDRIDALLAERAAIFDRAAIENVDLLVKLGTAGADEDKLERVALLEAFGRELAPLNARGPLRTELRRALPRDKRRAYDGLLRAYWEALLADERSATEREPDARSVATKERLRVLGKQIERSFERQVGERSREFERFLRELDLPAEKERRVREMATLLAQETLLNPSRQDQYRLFWKIYAELDDEQRARLMLLVMKR
jgi:hypothetical protein